MAEQKEVEESEESCSKTTKDSFIMVKKPQIIHYDSLPEPIPCEEPIFKDDVTRKDTPILGFEEFRKYKEINETRIITPYKSEATKKQEIKSETKVFPAVKIENVGRFLLERIKSVPVESLESLLQMIYIYPNVGFVTMNRPYMDLVNNYQPYSYAICNYNDKNEANYATISPNGLMEIYKGEADIMELDRVLVEYQLYCTLKMIPLFTYIYRWKAFMVWFKKIRIRKFVAAKNKIEAFFAQKYALTKKQ